MATAEALARLDGLIARLAPLAAVQPGEPVRAEDWNTLVGVVIEVARATLAAADTDGTVPPHEHPDQVKASWLDPALRARIDGAAAGARVPAADVTLTRLARRFEEVDGQVSVLRDQLTGAATRDLVREADFAQLRRNVDQVSGSGADDLTRLRRQVDGMAADVKRAATAADRLEVNGQAVDLGALTRDVAEMGKLRDQLRLPTGELFTATRLEQRFSELRATLVTEDELDKALKKTRFGLSPEQLGTLTGELATEVQGRVGADLDQLRRDLTTRTDERLAGIGAQVEQQVRDATPGIRDTLDRALADRLDGALTAARADIAESSDRRIAAAAGQLRTDLSGQIDAVRADIGQSVTASLRDQLPGQLSGVQQQLGTLAGRMDGAEGRLRGIDASVGSVTGRLGDLTAQLRDGLGRLDGRVTTEVAGVRGEIAAASTDFNAKLVASETRTGNRLTEFGRTVDTRFAGLNKPVDTRIDVGRGGIGGIGGIATPRGGG